MSADKPFSPDTDLRDALIDMLDTNEPQFMYPAKGMFDEEYTYLNSGLLADMILKVITDWTVELPPVEPERPWPRRPANKF